jgi:hypothetical protein
LPELGKTPVCSLVYPSVRSANCAASGHGFHALRSIAKVILTVAPVDSASVAGTGDAMKF